VGKHIYNISVLIATSKVWQYVQLDKRELSIGGDFWIFFVQNKLNLVFPSPGYSRRSYKKDSWFLTGCHCGSCEELIKKNPLAAE
jgi:hypothetical protein